MFLATHRLLVLRTQANFSHLFPSPLSTKVKSVCCKNTSCWLAQRVYPSPTLPWSALCSGTEGLSESSHKNPLELPGALTLLNVASPDCHTHTRGGNGSLQRALDSWGACSRSAGSRGIFGEKVSCIAQWKRARKPWKRRDVGCCVPRVKLGLTSFNNRLHTLRSFFLYHRWNLNSLFTEGLEALVTAAQGLKFHAHHETESSILTGPWLSFHSSADRRTLGSYWRQSSAWRVTTGWTWLFPITYRGGTLVKFINTGIYGDRTLGANIVRDMN